MKFEQRLGRGAHAKHRHKAPKISNAQVSHIRYHHHPLPIVMSLKQLPLRIRGALRVQNVRPFSSTAQPWNEAQSGFSLERL